MGTHPKQTRHLIVVLGDQLNRDAAVFDDGDSEKDVVWMAEADEESTHVPSHQVRTALFLSAMRHFAQALREDGFTVDYQQLDDDDAAPTLADALERCIGKRKPRRLVVTEPGDHRVFTQLRDVAERLDVPLDVLPDRHFLCSKEEFSRHAEGRKQLRMEFFYRAMRKKHDVLMEDGKPLGGAWNFDKDNRGTFGKNGPPTLPAPPRFKPDRITKDVLTLVAERFADHPGDLTRFNWPTTRADALSALNAFVQHALPNFGTYQDAMWTEEPFLFHSLLASSLNLKLISPREVIDAVERAHRADPETVPINAAEGFIRQILGWREYVRGVYWMYMPEYLDRNVLHADNPLPGFYWTGNTDMECLRQALQQTLQLGYAHHIQRLMVTGLFSLLFGVNPKEIHAWYLAVYVDAVEWVELPNTLGMSQYADGGVMASKPYVATGKYIQRMSNYCDGCRYDPAQSTGEAACPFTTLYWDFLLRHEERLAGNPRMKLQVRNLDRLDPGKRASIQEQAAAIRARYG